MRRLPRCPLLQPVGCPSLAPATTHPTIGPRTRPSSPCISRSRMMHAGALATDRPDCA